MKLTVHMIANAHLDPVWLWLWPAGVDEALATCRTACDMLDKYPDLYFTRGEAWVHAQIEKHDERLFKRIADHVSSGRWQIVNGWWVQADCNLPTAASFRKQAEIGKQYFREQFGTDVTVAYNVDSFGHCATLPRFLREAGMTSYVFMRPQESEKDLPSDLFLWEAPTGEAVTAFRISYSYASHTVADMEKTLKAAIVRASRDVGHTMCFFGVGDHGGGPTRNQIEWIREHANYGDGVELRFSHPSAFFKAVAESDVRLPTVRDELQYHAVGCYSVVHDIKQQVRRAENLLVQAEQLVNRLPGGIRPDLSGRIDAAWKRVLFNQFHDILAGSSIAPAYEHARDELGHAKAEARDIIVELARHVAAGAPACERQQMILTNTSSHPFGGYVEHEPWLGYLTDRPVVRLTDKSGTPVPCQILQGDAAVEHRSRLLMAADVPANGETILEVHRDNGEPEPSAFHVDGQKVESECINLRLAATGIDSLASAETACSYLVPEGIRICTFVDESDTWSHDWPQTTADHEATGHAARGYGYANEPDGTFSSDEPWAIVDKGPLRASVRNTLTFGDCSLIWQVILQKGEPIVRFRIRLHWQCSHRIVKLLIPCAFAPTERYDGIPDGELRRPLDGYEYPVHNYVALQGEDAAMAVVSADAYAADVQAEGLIRLTLLRCPIFAHHYPLSLSDPNTYPVTDQGVHEYEIALLPMACVDRAAITDEVNRQTHPIWIADSTLGMPQR